MTIKFTIEDLFNIPGAVLYNPDAFKPFSNVSIDSRNIKKNCAFVAIKGEQFDGHNFIKSAVQNGANVVVIDEKQLKNFDDINCVIVTVPDTIKAYGSLANIKRNKLNAKIISITGSNGKTSVKEFLAEILSSSYKVWKTEANNNNHIGVPLTILTAPSDTEILVLEHGTNHFDEIDYTAKIAQPDISFITNIGSSHLEFLNNEKGVLKEKRALFNHTNEDGVIIINKDDKHLKKLENDYSNSVTIGSGQSEIILNQLQYDENGFASLNIDYKNKNIKLKNHLPGFANTINLFYAVSIALLLKVNKQNIIKGIKNIKQVKGRLNLKKLNGFALVDDSYNANPSSFDNAIDFVKKNKSYKKKIFVIGDMFELGDKSEQYHIQLLSSIANHKNYEAYTLGEMMKIAKSKLKKNTTNIMHFDSREYLKSFIKTYDFSNSICLFKGSRGMKMEEFYQIALGGNE